MEEGTKEYRAVKSIVLGVHYNMQTPKMARTLWDLGVRFSQDYEQHVRETNRLRRLYLRRYPGLRAYMEDREAKLLRDQSSDSLTGRIRHLPLNDGRATKGYGHLLNQAINFPIQSLASDITGSALIDVERELLRFYHLDIVSFYEALIDWQRKVLTKAPGCGIMEPRIALLFNEVHDSLLLDIPPDDVVEITELVVETMRAVPSLRKLVPSFSCPLDVDIKIGSHWGAKKG